MVEKHLSKSLYDSPFGELTLLSSKKGLCYIALPGRESGVDPWVARTFGHRISIVEDDGCRDALDELDAYFQGQLRTFKVALDLRGTPFQKKVWGALMQIPYGETRSYGEIAKAIHNPKAVRAVGRANGTNPVPIIVPCHRVIQAGGKLGGYGGGLALKKALLERESRFLKS